MTVTLNGGISASAIHLRVNAAVADPAPYYQIGSEVLRVESYFENEADGALKLVPNYTRWTVARGQVGTVKATHADGATLTPLYPQVGNPAIDTGGGAAEPGTVVVDEPNNVYLYATDGPPASTTGVGGTYYVGQSPASVYLNTGTGPEPVWTAQDITGGVFAGADPPVAPSSPGQWYVQYLLGLNAPGDLGYGVALYQDDGAGDWLGPIADTTTGLVLGAATVPTDAADAKGIGEAGRGSMAVDRSTPGAEGWYSQVNTKEAPVWSPLFASFSQMFGAAGTIDPGAMRLVNVTFPSGTTYKQIKNAFINTGGGGLGSFLGFPNFEAVRIAALFHHILPSGAQAAGTRVRWDEIQYLFFADKPVADPDTGVITYTELGDSDTSLGDVVLQMLAQGGVY